MPAATGSVRAAADPEDLARDAYVRGSPYVAAARLRLARTRPDNPFVERIETSPGAALNNIGRQRRPSDPRYRDGVGVSTDTLYTSAWVDLADGPFVLHTPDFAERYYSFQVAGADTASNLAVGARTHGAKLPPLLLHGPDQVDVVPDGMLSVPCVTRYVNLPGRMLVNPEDPNDMAAAHRLQDAVNLSPWPARPGDRTQPNPPGEQIRREECDDADEQFLHELGACVQEGGLNPEDRAWSRDLDALGIDTRHGFTALPADGADQIRRGLARGRAEVDERATSLGVQHGGWTVNLQGSRFEGDDLLRAAVARDQIYVTVPEEGIYPLAHVDAGGDTLDGRGEYRIHFQPGGLPPARAFWSITCYSHDGYLVPNRAGIHALGDRSDLHRNSDDSVTIHVSHRPLGENWLPAPHGSFYLMMRLFVPRPSAQSGRWLPPAVERIS